MVMAVSRDMSMQDTASGVALWRQVADGIERGIADGRFAAGEKLPGEMEIAETYRVNRHTVRRALADAGRARAGARRTRQRNLCRGAAPRLSACARARASPRSSAPTATSRVAGCIERLGRRRDARTRARTGIEDRRAAGAHRGDPPGRPHADLRLAPPGCRRSCFRARATVFAATRSMTKLLEHYGVRDYRPRATRITAGIGGRNRCRAARSARWDWPILVVDATDHDHGRQAAGDEAFAVRGGAGGVSGGERVSGATLLSPCGPVALSAFEAEGHRSERPGGGNCWPSSVVAALSGRLTRRLWPTASC